MKGVDAMDGWAEWGVMVRDAAAGWGKGARYNAFVAVPCGRESGTDPLDLLPGVMSYQSQVVPSAWEALR